MRIALLAALVLPGAFARPPCQANDLRCIELFPTADFHAVSGIVELTPADSPFGTAVTPDGTHRYVLVLSLAGLPAGSEAGSKTTYVAWVAAPDFDPMIRLGPVGNGSTRVGSVALDKFLVLVTAEPVEESSTPAGPIVLRGTSPSMALLPHEAPALLSVAAGGLDQDHGTAHGETAGWPPPMNPNVAMPPGLHPEAIDIEPFLPFADPANLPVARPREMLRLADGDSLSLVAAPVQRSIGGRMYAMYGFNGQYPGPLIRVPQDATIVVGFTNRLPLPTAVHWHGVRLDNAFDGVPHVTQPPVPPGGTFRYEVHFPDAGIYWYHPHHREDITQDLGLYGNLRVDAAEPGWLSPADREEVLMLDDLLIGGHGLVPYGREAATHALMGRFGNVMLVNGEPEYRLEVPRGAVVRFFLTNAASTRIFNVSFGSARIKLVASDVGRYEREQFVESVVIAPAERYVVEVLFEDSGPVLMTNRVRAIDPMYGNFFSEIDTLGVIDVGEQPVTTDRSRAFDRLRENADVQADLAPYRRHFDRPVDKELVLTVETDSLPFPLEPLLTLERSYIDPVEWAGTMPLMNWATTGRNVRWILRDPATGEENGEIGWRFQRGEVVKLRLTNSVEAIHSMQHPIHLHGQRFLVLARNGVPSGNLVWKDTVLVPAGETATLLLDLSNPGEWMLHCHIAEHLEAGMKTVLTVEP